MKTTHSDRPLVQAPQAAPGEDSAAGASLHLFDRLAVLYRYRFIALAVFGVAVVLRMTATYTTVPQYKASARLLIEEERSALSDFKDGYVAYADPEPFYQTQYRILKGRDLARRAVRKLRLDAVPEFNGTARQPLSFTGFLLAAPREAVVAARRLVSGRPAEPPASAPVTVDEDGLIAGFLSRVEVQPVANSRLVDVFFRSADAAFAARAVNTLAEEYVQQNLEFKLQATEKSLTWVSEEVVRQQRKVEESEQALADYREDQNALSLEDRQNIVVARLNQLNDALTRAKTARVQKQALFDSFQTGGKNASDTMPAVGQSAFIQTLKARIGDLQREKVRLSERYGELHPEIKKVNAAIDEATGQLAAETAKAIDAIRSDYRLAVAEERTLAAALEEQKRAAMDLNRKSVSYTVLEREAQSNRQVYEALLQREKELRVVSNSRGNNVRLLDRGEQPKAPFTPQTSRDWLVAVILGAVLAVGVAAGLDYLNDTIRNPDDIARWLGVPALGYVPAVSSTRRPTFSGSAYDHFSEALRMLRTACATTFAGSGPRVLMVTSAQPLEGKTTTSCNLALALAYGGARVLLIDADLRRPNLHRVLDVPNERGLADLLSGTVKPREATQQTETRNLVVMTSGRVPPNPSELLASARMRTLLSHLREGPFDWIIIDTPPVLAVTDSMVVAPLADGVLLVIGSEMTRRSLAQRAIESLSQSRPGPMAAVLNKVDLTRDKYYYSKRYGYETTSYYAEAL